MFRKKLNMNLSIFFTYIVIWKSFPGTEKLSNISKQVVFLMSVTFVIFLEILNIKFSKFSKCITIWKSFPVTEKLFHADGRTERQI